MEYSINPREHEIRESRQIIQNTLETCKSIIEKEKNIRISLGWTEDRFVKEKMNGTTGLTYSYNHAEIEFNSRSDNWKNALKKTTAHEFSHMWFYEKLGNNEYEDISFIWQHLLMEAHAQIFEEKATGEKSRMKDEVPTKKLRELWPKLKEKLDESSEKHGELFTGQGDLPMWVGYSLAYQIGEKILEENELEEFPDMKRSNVIEAGNALFR